MYASEPSCKKPCPDRGGGSDLYRRPQHIDGRDGGRKIDHHRIHKSGAGRAGGQKYHPHRSGLCPDRADLSGGSSASAPKTGGIRSLSGGGQYHPDQTQDPSIEEHLFDLRRDSPAQTAQGSRRDADRYLRPAGKPETSAERSPEKDRG